MTERWLDERGVNAVNALDAAWVTNYIAALANRQTALSALQDFYHWAGQSHLLVENPLSFVGKAPAKPY